MTKLQVTVIVMAGLVCGLLFWEYSVPDNPTRLADQPARPTSQSAVANSFPAPKHTDMSAAVEARLAGVETGLKQLADGYRELTQQIQTLKHTKRSTAQAPSDAILTAPHHDQATTQSEQDKKQARLALLGTELAREGPDPIWTKKATDNIVATFNREQLNGNSLLGATCGTTMCRLEVRHADEDSRERFFDEFFQALGWQGNAVGDVTDNHDGSYSTTLFVSRQDYMLPMATAER